MAAFTASVAIAALAAVVPAFAAVEPTAPYGGTICRAGQPCVAQWNVDTTGEWTSTRIELMTGSNFQMSRVQLLTTTDGTKAPGTYTFTTPEVDPYSQIYFLQFTNNGANPVWTTRFTIADADGTTTPPPNATQPDGASIGWGIGRLRGSAAGGGATTSSAAGNASIPIASSSVVASSAVSSLSVSSSSAVSSSTDDTLTSTTTVPRASSASNTTPTGDAARLGVRVVAVIGVVAAVMAVLA